MALDLWLQLIGRDEVTGWRWRNDGFIATENILGRQFITSDEIKRFWTRAKAGEFAREVKGAAADARAKKRRPV